MTSSVHPLAGRPWWVRLCRVIAMRLPWGDWYTVAQLSRQLITEGGPGWLLCEPDQDLPPHSPLHGGGT